MTSFLFVFGYEAPDEWVRNARSGTDDESSEAVWVTAASEEEAEAKGRRYAEDFVRALFEEAAVEDFPGWAGSGYAHWIERDPSTKWTQAELVEIPRFDE